MDSTLSGEPVVEIPGAILIGGFLQSFLLGVVVTQTIKYWADYRDDSWRKRLFVATVVIISMYVIRLSVSLSIANLHYQPSNGLRRLQVLENHRSPKIMGKETFSICRNLH
jgi:hypothetical protein